MQILGRGFAWLDTGTYESLHEAASYVRTVQHVQNTKIACLEEIAWRKGWIDIQQLEKLAIPMNKNSYGKYLLHLIEENA